MLGRFAERHGQPIVRIYGVRDASLRSSIRPNSKGPLIGVAMSPSGAHVAIVAGDAYHTLTVWQRRHLDWTGGAFIVARQMVGANFVPNRILYVHCHRSLVVARSSVGRSLLFPPTSKPFVLASGSVSLASLRMVRMW